MACFVIVAKGEPLYTCDFSSPTVRMGATRTAGASAGRCGTRAACSSRVGNAMQAREDATFRQYAVHSSLDMVDEAVWNNGATYVACRLACPVRSLAHSARCTARRAFHAATSKLSTASTKR